LTQVSDLMDPMLLTDEDLEEDIAMGPQDLARFLSLRGLYENPTENPIAAATAAGSTAAVSTAAVSSPQALQVAERAAASARAFMMSKGQQEARMDALAAKGLRSVAALSDPSKCTDEVGLRAGEGEL
jgi:hypothetical protein